MGVSGCGKSTVGSALAQVIGAVYVDGDDLHPPENVAKMARGEPLTDADRWPWLDRVAFTLAQSEKPIVLGCSALKRIYRDRIRTAGRTTFVHLTGRPEVIADRMANRPGHFMPPHLLASQLATLEPPGPDEGAITVDIVQPTASMVEQIVKALNRPT